MYRKIFEVKAMSNFRTKPKIRIDFNSPDGNIYFILAALKAEFNNARSYDDALDIIRKYVDIAEC